MVLGLTDKLKNEGPRLGQLARLLFSIIYGQIFAP